MDIGIVRTCELAIVQCRGRLVLGDGADLLRDAARRALSAGQDVVLDLGNVTQIDAHGAGVLAGLFGWARRQGRGLSLARVGERVRRVLRVTGLDAVVRDVEEPGACTVARGLPDCAWPGAFAPAPTHGTTSVTMPASRWTLRPMSDENAGLGGRFVQLREEESTAAAHAPASSRSSKR